MQTLASEYLLVVFIILQLLMFAFGLARLLRRLHINLMDDMQIATYAIAALLLLIEVAYLASFAGLAMIPVLTAIYVTVVAYGIFELFKNYQDVNSYLRQRIRQIAPYLAMMIYGIGVWGLIQRDLVALPSHGDGIHHLVFLTRILQRGHAQLSGQYVSFRELFGEQLFHFYPSGMSTLISITSGWLYYTKLVSIAAIAKAWMIITVGVGPVAAWYCAVRMLGISQLWTGLLLYALLMPGFRFPLEALHEGGIPRIMAVYLIYVPAVWLALYGRRIGIYACAFGLLAAPLFMLHPHGLYVFAVCWAFGVARLLIAERTQLKKQNIANFVISRRLLGHALLALLGVVAALALLFVFLQLSEVSGAVAENNKFVAVGRKPLAEVNQVIAALLLEGYYQYPKIWVLPLLGFAALAIRAISLRSLRVPLCFLVYLSAQPLVIAAYGASSLPLANFLSRIFYAQYQRMAELFYFPLFVFTSFAIAELAGLIMAVLPRLRVPKPKVAVVCLTILLAGYFHPRSLKFCIKHLRYWDGLFHTPLNTKVGALIDWIAVHVPDDALLITHPMELDVLEAATGRSMALGNAECPVDPTNAVCDKRLAYIAQINAQALNSLQAPTALSCLDAAKAFARPVYIINRAGHQQQPGQQLCQDLQYIASVGEFNILRYQQ